MSERQVWISKSKNMIPVIEAAHETFPDAASDSQALTRALFHWYHSRQENSKRGALARLETEVAKQGRILQAICERLGIDMEAINAEQ